MSMQNFETLGHPDVLAMSATLMQQGENISGLSSEDITVLYQRLQLASTLVERSYKQHATKEALPALDSIADTPQADIDALAATLFNDGKKGFMTALQAYIKKNTPAAKVVEKIIEKIIDKSTVTTRTVDANGVEVTPDKTAVSLSDTRDLATVFKVSGLSTKLTVPICDYELITPNPDYCYQNLADTGVLEVLAIAQEFTENVWLSGEKGTGKTTLAQDFAAVTKRPFFRIQHSKTMEAQELIGGLQIPDGTSSWQDGLLLQAIKTPYAVILLDEPTVNPACCEIYQTLLDERFLDLQLNGGRVHVAEGVLFIAADNTSGHGDDTGRYVGTMATNGALGDRFICKTPVYYMTPVQEAKILRKYGANAKQAKAIAQFAARTRNEVATGDLEEPISLRRLTALTRLIASGVGQERAFQFTVLEHVAHSQDRETYKHLYNAHMPNLEAMA